MSKKNEYVNKSLLPIFPKQPLLSIFDVLLSVRGDAFKVVRPGQVPHGSVVTADPSGPGPGFPPSLTPVTLLSPPLPRFLYLLNLRCMLHAGGTEYVLTLERGVTLRRAIKT